MILMLWSRRKGKQYVGYEGRLGYEGKLYTHKIKLGFAYLDDTGYPNKIHQMPNLHTRLMGWANSCRYKKNVVPK